MAGPVDAGAVPGGPGSVSGREADAGSGAAGAPSGVWSSVDRARRTGGGAEAVAVCGTTVTRRLGTAATRATVSVRPTARGRTTARASGAALGAVARRTRGVGAEVADAPA
ncbi:hypothetical protein ACIRTB_15875 [Streptomyces sp. NPDC101158]|uniref:hypothetical protein n=1 Tax=Streptomyces sp. NPDC101158 TaxID=3366117 RepID=UPI003807C90F